MYRETFWKEIGRRGGNEIRMDVSCRIGDKMRQQKHTLEERSRRLQNSRERASQRRSQETSERDPVESRTPVIGRVRAVPGNISISSHNMHDELSHKA